MWRQYDVFRKQTIDTGHLRELIARAYTDRIRMWHIYQTRANDALPVLSDVFRQITKTADFLWETITFFNLNVFHSSRSCANGGKFWLLWEDCLFSTSSDAKNNKYTISLESDKVE
jgi:hypothetical protein